MFKKPIDDPCDDRCGATRIHEDGPDDGLHHVTKHLVTQRFILAVVLVLNWVEKKQTW